MNPLLLIGGGLALLWFSQSSTPKQKTKPNTGPSPFPSVKIIPKETAELMTELAMRSYVELGPTKISVNNAMALIGQPNAAMWVQEKNKQYKIYVYPGDGSQFVFIAAKELNDPAPADEVIVIPKNQFAL